ncbi:SAF domain-containing protein [Luteipulveratus halotolerans]|uniref:SAF domain-containing protein n=1 Tax=Luteipulveratus halotolerans TaxID=1631356 RepID=A0A0L6CDL2_9MICO|nr:SAF domain-containing protein [Luteipulveratus halotolerans]KNX35907.1 hypothetical protein VV01_21875 [Luteipulveratus halotolerans]
MTARRVVTDDTKTSETKGGGSKISEQQAKQPAVVATADTAQKAPLRPTPPSVRTRRSRTRIAAGVALMVVCGLAGGALVTRGEKPESVLVLRHSVEAGDSLQRSDLTTKQVTNGKGLNSVSQEQIGSLVGRYVTGDLPAGTLVSPAMVADRFGPIAGRSTVGIAVKLGQRPAAGLTAGQQVRLVLGAGQGTQANALPKGLLVGQTWRAQIVAIGTSSSQDGLTTVDVSVSTEDAPTVATAASLGSMALVLDPMPESR